MKRFKTTVTRIDEYIIEIDDNELNEQWMDDFRHVFFPFYEYDEHAEQLAQMRARFGEGFIEGYGNVLIDGRKPWHITDENQVNKAINIKIISEDNDCDVEVEEIE